MSGLSDKEQGRVVAKDRIHEIDRAFGNIFFNYVKNSNKLM
jgi:hypothetical protein